MSKYVETVVLMTIQEMTETVKSVALMTALTTTETVRTVAPMMIQKMTETVKTVAPMTALTKTETVKTAALMRIQKTIERMSDEAIQSWNLFGILLFTVDVIASEPCLWPVDRYETAKPWKHDDVPLGRCCFGRW